MREYRAVYQRGWRGESYKTVFCDHVETDGDLIRFVDEDGNSRWTIETRCMIEYEEQGKRP